MTTTSVSGTSGSSSSSSQTLPQPEGVLTRMPKDIVVRCLFPFLDRPMLAGERGLDASLRQLTRRWFSYGNVPLLNWHFRDLVNVHRRAAGNSQTAFHGAERRIIAYINTVVTPQGIPEHIARGCHLISFRIFFHRNPQALLNPPNIGSVLHIAVSPHPGRAAFSLSFVSFLCQVNRRENLGLLHREDEQHRRPIDRLCSSGLRPYAITQTLPLLLEGEDINQRNSQGHTALHCAAAAPITPKSIAVLRALLEREADPNVLNGAGETPLEIYVRGIFSYLAEDSDLDGWQEGLGLLLNHGVQIPCSLLKYADPDWSIYREEANEGSDVLYHKDTVGRHIQEMFQRHCAEHPPNWLLRDPRGETYLHWLISLNSFLPFYEFCKRMDASYPQVLQELFLTRNDGGFTPIELASSNGSEDGERIRCWIKVYAPFDSHWALLKCQREGRLLSLEHRADPNLSGSTRETSLEIYVRKLFPLLADGWKLRGWEEGLELLLKNGEQIPFSLLKYADPTSEEPEFGGRGWYVTRQIREVFQKHFAQHAPPNWLVRGPNGETYLHWLRPLCRTWQFNRYMEWMQKMYPKELQLMLRAEDGQKRTPMDLRLADERDEVVGIDGEKKTDSLAKYSSSENGSSRLKDKVDVTPSLDLPKEATLFSTLPKQKTSPSQPVLLPAPIPKTKRIAPPPIDLHKELCKYKGKDNYLSLEKLPDNIAIRALNELKFEVSFTKWGSPVLTFRSSEGEIVCLDLNAFAQMSLGAFTINHVRPISLSRYLETKYLLCKVQELFRIGDQVRKGLLTRFCIAIRKCIAYLFFCLFGKCCPGSQPTRRSIEQEVACPLEVPKWLDGYDAFVGKHPPDRVSAETGAALYSSERILAIYRKIIIV